MFSSMGEKDLSAYHPGETSWEEDGYTVTRTTQWSGPGCHDGCAVLFYTKDGKLEKVEGDPCAPYNKGRLCMRCLALPELVNHPDRVRHPLRRVGERGENKWEQISWDEAIDEITTKAKRFLEESGPACIQVAIGTGRNAFWEGQALALASFGSTNAAGFLSGDTCYVPRMVGMTALLGGAAVADCAQMYEKGFNDPEWQAPDYMLIWGNNPIKSNGDGFFGHWVVDLMQQGTKLIVVDPSLTWLASRAEYFLQVRPGTDGALVLAMLNVVIGEDLYDHDFVEHWCYGFDELSEYVKEFTPEWAGEICGVDPETIRGAARAFANARSASVQWGLAVDTQTHGVAGAHGIVALWSICGFVDIPGGMIMPTTGYTVNDCAGIMSSLAPDNVVPKPENYGNFLGIVEYPFRAPMGCSLSDMSLEAIETENRTQVRMVFAASSNSFVNAGADAIRWYEALQKVEFVVVSDLFMTPTITAAADIVLPVAMSCERNFIRDWWAPFRAIKRVTDPGECRSDEEIVLTIGKAMRPEVFSQWDDDVDLLNWLMERRKNTTYNGDFDQLNREIFYYEPWVYRKYEKGMLRPDGQPGFNTPTGRIELWSSLLAQLKLNPLPYYKEPRCSPVSDPALAEEFPFVLTTGRRSWEFFHSEHRQSPTMREFHPDPLVEINDKDAEALGIEDGDWVWLQNQHGKCKQRAYITPTMKQGIVSSEHGWWFPERNGSKEGGFYGAFESNANMLTPMCDIGPTGYGAPYKAQMCKIYKVTDENDSIKLTEEEYKRSVDSRMFARPENA